MQPDGAETGTGNTTVDRDAEADDAWKDVLLARLHRLSPAGFEEFTLYLLRTFGLELTRVGGASDEGIDGIGLAPISAVPSSRVAVQAKRAVPVNVTGLNVYRRSKGGHPPAMAREVVTISSVGPLLATAGSAGRQGCPEHTLRRERWHG